MLRPHCTLMSILMLGSHRLRSTGRSDHWRVPFALFIARTSSPMATPTAAIRLLLKDAPSVGGAEKMVGHRPCRHCEPRPWSPCRGGAEARSGKKNAQIPGREATPTRRWKQPESASPAPAASYLEVPVPEGQPQAVDRGLSVLHQRNLLIERQGLHKGVHAVGDALARVAPWERVQRRQARV